MPSLVPKTRRRCLQKSNVTRFFSQQEDCSTWGDPHVSPWGSPHPAHSPRPQVSSLGLSAPAPANTTAGPVSSSPQPCPVWPWAPPSQAHPRAHIPARPCPQGGAQCSGLGLPRCPLAAPLSAGTGPGARPCPDGPLDLQELLAQAGCHQWALGKTNESSHLRHMVLLCSLLLLLLLNEQLLLLPAPGCSQFFKASLHLVQHLGSVAYHQLDAVLSRLQ